MGLMSNTLPSSSCPVISSQWGARKQPKRILGFPKLIYEDVQNTGVTFYHKLMVPVDGG